MVKCKTPKCEYIVHSSENKGKTGYCCLCCGKNKNHGPACEKIKYDVSILSAKTTTAYALPNIELGLNYISNNYRFVVYLNGAGNLKNTGLGTLKYTLGTLNSDLKFTPFAIQPNLINPVNQPSSKPVQILLDTKSISTYINEANKYTFSKPLKLCIQMNLTILYPGYTRSVSTYTNNINIYNYSLPAVI
jgi:hypothetical protein